ncbi:MAG: hypothetical protein CM15mP49_02990 [Actinomycetota bacterium]|nr:MAG: hypothetical protein CM15mP49_02990 [Actinomycetota bacterium]
MTGLKKTLKYWIKDIESTRKAYPLVKHPVIRTHPESGEKAVFTNNFFTSHIDGLSEDESNRFCDD